MNDVWVTADLHLNHAKVIQFCDRSPFKDVGEMNEALIENWNSRVKPRDVVHFLGDLCFGDPAPFKTALNGYIHFYLGNHDVENRVKRAGFASVQHVKMIRVDGQKIWLSHYAHKVWPSSHHAAWHLYGHSHGTLEDPVEDLSVDVGVDATRDLSRLFLGQELEHTAAVYRPWSIDEIAVIMKNREQQIKKKPVKPRDHHGRRSFDE